jgi:hypothetical protein
MADALRAALRLFPAVKSVPGESAAASTRSSVVKRSNGRASEQQQQQQSVLFFALPFSSSPLQQQKSSGCFGNNVQAVTGLARFARAVLAYVGAGISAVAANQLAGSCCIVHGKYVIYLTDFPLAIAAQEAFYSALSLSFCLSFESNRPLGSNARFSFSAHEFRHNVFWLLHRRRRRD